MSEPNADGAGVIAARLKDQSIRDAIRVTVHAHQEMVAEETSLDEVRQTLLDSRVLENYPDHKRGACCLVCGRGSRGRFIHVVCTTTLEVAIIITVYEPRAPKWATPFERGKAG